MKTKKMLSLSLAIVFVFMTTLLPVSALRPVSGVTYYVDAVPTANAVWTNSVAGGKTFGYQSGASNMAPTETLLNDPSSGKKIMKFSVPKGVAENAINVGATELNMSLDNLVAWYEVKFQFETDVTDFAITGGAYSLFRIYEDGTVKVGYDNASYPSVGLVNNFVPEAGKWYHLIIAADNTNKYSGTDTRIYAWINGTLLTTGEEDTTGATITRNANETKNISQFLLNTPRTTNKDVNMFIEFAKFYTASNSVSFDGTTHYVNAVPTANAVWTNSVAGAKTFGYQSVASNMAPTETMLIDPLSGKDIMKLSVPKGSAENAIYVGTRELDMSLDNLVAWYEVKFKFENEVANFGLVGGAHSLFRIHEDGTVNVGYDSASYPTVGRINNFTAEANKWYHLIIAADNIDKYHTDTRFYAWINGTQLTTGEEGTTGATITRNANETSGFNQFLLNTPRTANKDLNMFVEFAKFYTSTKSVSSIAFDPTPDTGNYVPKALFNIDFDSFDENTTPVGIRANNSKIIVDNPRNHFYRINGGGYADLLTYNYNVEDFSGDVVVQADFKISSSNTSSMRVSLREHTSSARSEALFDIGTDGCFYHPYTGFKYSSVSCKGEWVNVAIALHHDTKKYDVYVNGVKVQRNLGYNYSNLSNLIYWVRFEYTGSTSSSTYVDMDNLWVYKSKIYRSADKLAGVGGEWIAGKNKAWEHEIDTSAISPNYNIFNKIIPTPLVNTTTRLTDYSEAKNAYKDAICFVEGSTNLWIKDAKYSSGYTTIWEKENLLAAAPVLAAISNKSLNVSGNTATIGNISATVGNSYITVGGTRIDTEVPVQKYNGSIYIPIKEFAIYGMKKWYGFSTLGFGVIANEERDVHYEVDSNRPNLHTVGNTSHMMAYLIMDLPNAALLKSMLPMRKPTQRPYIAGTAEYFAELKHYAETDEMARKLSLTTIANANSIYNTTYTSTSEEGSTPSPIFSTSVPFSLYWAYYMTGDRKYVVKAEELALQMSALSHWASDFHFLTTSTAMKSASYFYDLFYNEFSQSTLNTIANAIIEKGLNPANSYYEGNTTGTHNDWCTRCSNWNGVSNSGVLVAASTLIGEGHNDNLMAKSLERAFVSMGYFMQFFSPDGSSGEGIGYSNFTISNVCPSIEVVENVFGTDFGMFDYPGFLEAGYFIPNATSSKYAFSLNEDTVEGTSPPDMSLWFAKRNNDQDLADYVWSFYDLNSKNLEDYAPALFMHFVPASGNKEPVLDLDSVYTEAGLGFSRDNFTSKATFMGVHGGYNHVAGGRYDYGTFRFDAFGIRFATATGNDSYSLAGISNFAWNQDYYTIRSEGHNVYVVNPDEDPGQNRYTAGIPHIQEQKDKGIIYTLDMTTAYSQDLQSAKRGFMLTNDRKVMVIQDEMVPYDPGDDEFYWFWHTYADIEIDNVNDIVTLTRDNKKVKLYFDATVDVTLEEMDIEPLPTTRTPTDELGVVQPQLQNEEFIGMKKIAARFTGNGKPITFRVIAEPVGQEYPRGALTPISEWSIPDGSTADEYYSKAKTITANGIEIGKFDPDVLDYTMYYDGEMPTIAVESDGNITITQAEASGDTAIVKIQDKNYTGNYKIYTITLVSRSEALGTVKNLIECDFTDHAAIGGTQSTTAFYQYSKEGSVASSLEIDTQRNSRVLKYSLSAGSLVNLDRTMYLTNTDTPGGIYYEFSFKTDKYADMVAQVYNLPFFSIDSTGNMYGYYSQSGKEPIGTYRPGEWYNIKIVYDDVETYWGLYTRTYIYVNGNKFAKVVDSFGSEKWEATMLNRMPSASVSKNVRFYMEAPSSENVNFYLDDVYFYYTEKSPYGIVDVDSDLAGTRLYSDLYNVNRDNAEIYVSDFTTVKSVLDSITPYTDSSLVFCKLGNVVGEQDKATTTALSGTLYVPGTTGKLLKPYELIEGKDGFTANWSLLKGDGSVVNDLSTLAGKDVIKLSANVTNNTDFDKPATIVFAAYDGDTLIGCRTQTFTVKSLKTATVNMLETITLPETFENLSVKAFIWSDLSGLKPVISGNDF